jgi:DNA-binding NtrC family response regulator
MNANARVLVIDDDEIMQEGYRSVLAGANFTVQAARTVDQAFEMLAHQAFDVVLLAEYLTADSAGQAALHAIKELWPDIEVVVITGTPSLEVAKEAIRLGAYNCLAKPVRSDEVSKVTALAAIQKKWTLHRIPSSDSAQPTNEGESS